MDHKFLVSAYCFTYNHAPFIKYTLDGFCSQKTTFPYLCIIVDDASTDRNDIEIANYVNTYFDKTVEGAFQEETEDYISIYAQHKTNLNCWFTIILLKYNHYGKKAKGPYISKWTESSKYLAACEGDDFWISPEKLQEQVMFLENNPDYVLVHTDAIVVNQYSQEIKCRKPSRISGNATEYLLKYGNFVTTASTCFRNHRKECNDIIKNIPFPLMLGDLPTWIILSTYGKFKFINQEMVAYRVLPESQSHFREIDKMIAFQENVKKISIYFNSLFNVGIEEDIFEKRFRIEVVRECAKISRLSFLKTWIKLVKDYPSQLLNKRMNALFFIRVILNKSR